MPARRAWLDACWVGLTRALVTLTCWWSGFRAISDDDYSRVVIAARFAAAPSLDPSGTSWLPLPFWIYGVPMALFGDSLEVARAVALLVGIASAVLVWAAARVLGLSPRTALVAGLGAVLLPYGAWLSAATVPEAATAALVLFGAVSLVRPEARLRLGGGLALAAACFCRYEAWAPALVFSACGVLAAVRQRRRELWLPALLPALPMGAWLLHGLVRHGDALFFVARVTQYRAALGHETGGFLSALVGVPWAVVRFEPELCSIVLVALGLSVGKGRSPFTKDALGPVLALLALVAFLVAAQATGGSATHHPERSLLPVFWFLTLVAAGLLEKLAEQPKGWRLPALALPLALLSSLLLRPAVRDTFVDRSEEEQVGRLLRDLHADHVALDTDDFGFFAVQAALGHDKGFPLADRDPRKPVVPAPGSSAELDARLKRGDARWLVTMGARRELAAPLGTVRATTPRFVVLQLGR